MTGVARPVLTCGAIRHRIVLNGGASAAPGVVGRAGDLGTVCLVARRTFPAMHARRFRVINTLAPFFTAPTVMLRAGFGFQMSDFATGIIFIDITVPRMIVRKDRVSAGRIINLVTSFAVPVTLRTRFCK